MPDRAVFFICLSTVVVHLAYCGGVSAVAVTGEGELVTFHTEAFFFFYSFDFSNKLNSLCSVCILFFWFVLERAFELNV